MTLVKCHHANHHSKAPDAARQVGQRERKIVEHCKPRDFIVEKLKKLVSTPTSQNR